MATDAPARRLSSEALLTSSASIATTLLAIVGSLIIARALGPAGRGDWAVIAALALLVGTVGTLGVPSAVSYGLAQRAVGERAGYLRAALIAAATLALVAAVACVALGVAFGPGDGATLPLVLAGGISAAIVMHQVLQQAVLTAGPLRWYAAAQVTPAVVTLLAVVLLALVGRLDVLAVVVVSALSAACGAAVAWAGLRSMRVMSRDRNLRYGRGVVKHLRPDLAYAAATFATISLTQVVHRTDVLIVGGYKGSAAAGLYAVAVQMGDLLMVMPAALGVLLFRRGARSIEGHWQDAIRVLAWTAPFAVASALVIGVLAEPMIRTFFGDDFAGAVRPLRWLLPGVVLLALQSLVSNYLAGRGRPRAVLYAWTAAAVFTIVADLIVVPRHGIVGAAAVSSASYLLVFGLHVKPLLDCRARSAASLA